MLKKLLVASLVAICFAAPAAFAMDQVMYGSVADVNIATDTVYLVGGMTLVPAPNLSIEPIHKGQDVTFAYHKEPDGKNVITAFWIESEGASHDRGPGFIR